MPKYFAILSPDFVTRNAPLWLKKPMARILSSLFISATGFPTSATDCAISSSSSSLTLTIFSGSLCVNAVYDVAVEQSLMAVSGASVDKIKKVISHPQALAQCAKFISSRGWETETAQSTSSAAMKVSQMGDETVAAIGCAEAAELYGLSVLQKNINESRANTTRFGVFSRAENTSAGYSESDGFSLVFTVKNEAGALADALGVIGEAGFNMRTLRSRPRKELVWNYYFYLEAEGALRSEAGEKMLCDLRKYCDRLKVVGIYR